MYSRKYYVNRNYNNAICGESCIIHNLYNSILFKITQKAKQ